MKTICAVRAYIKARVSCCRPSDFTLERVRSGWLVYFASENYGNADNRDYDEVGEAHCKWCAKRHMIDSMRKFGCWTMTKEPKGNLWSWLFGGFVK